MGTSIPSFHCSDLSAVRGAGEVYISSRDDAITTGTFQVRLDVHFDPAGADDYPTGSLMIQANLSDSARGTYTATSVELVNSFGKHNPTVVLTGRCKADLVVGEAPRRGLRYWLMVVNNRVANAPLGTTPDVVGFAIHDRDGDRVAYGCGPLRMGDFEVKAR